MKFGVNSLIWTGAFNREHLPLLPRLKEAGFDGLEIVVFDLAGFPIAETRRQLEANQMECTFCTAVTNDASCISEDAAARRKARTYVEDCIKVAADLGTKTFAGVLYSPIGYLPGRRRTEGEWNREVEFLQGLGESLERNDMILALEPINRYETFFLNTIGDSVRLCEEVGNPRIGILLDTYHANIEERDVADAVRTAGKHLMHIHACENDRGIPGTGHMPWQGIFDGLRHLNYNGWLIIESFGYTIKEIATAACIWRDLAITPEDIAFEGVKFLRKMAAQA